MIGVLPTIAAPDDALSAIVSTIVIFQSRIRESTISSAGSRYRTALLASLTVTPGPRRGAPRTKAISGSIRGWMNVRAGIGRCSGWNMLAVRWP
jgi:hypothetical protein